MNPLWLLFCAIAAQETPELQDALKKLRPAAGLAVELVAAEPQIVNPVAFSIDEAGRFYVVETHRLGHCVFDVRGHLDWLEDDLACRTVDDREAMCRKRLGPKAVELTKSSERVRILEDRNGDGRVDEAATFAEGFNTITDGIAAGILARDGNVWFANVPNLWLFRGGDRKVLHTGYGVHFNFMGHDLHGLCFGPDGKLYFTMGDRGLQVKTEGRLVECPDTGTVLRCNPDGSGLEIVHVGLRNPQELAFDRYGNLFTVDNNCDAGDKARLVHVVEGGDSGWRVGYQHAPGRGFWMSERLWELEAAATAPSIVPPLAHVGHGPAGFAVHPGAARLPDREQEHFFLCDFPGEVLSFSVKPKGASFEMTDLHPFLSGVWPTDVEVGPDGAVYVLDWVQGWSLPQKGRIYRLYDPRAGRVERPRGPPLELLAHPDQRVRQAAQFALVSSRNVDGLAGIARESASRLARLHAIWGLSQLGRAELVRPLLRDADDEVRAQAAKVLGDVEGLRDPSARVRFFAALSLGKARRKDAVGPILEMLRENGDRDAYLRHAGVASLAWIGDADALIKAGKDASRAVRLAALLALRRMGRAEVSMFLQDPELLFEAARAIYDTPIPAAMPSLAALLPKCPKEVLSRALNAASRVGSAASLAAFAANPDGPPDLRQEAVRELAEWERPPARDRLIGVWRPMPPRPPARDVAAPVFAELVRNPGEKPRLRVEALKALAGWDPPQLASAIAVAVEDRDETLRKEGVRLLHRLPDAAARLESLAQEGPMAVRQSALASLSAIKSVEADRILGRMLDALLAGKLPPALHLDLLEACASRSQPVQEKVARFEASRPASDPLASYRETLDGGDPQAGRKIYFERPDAGCVKCHKAAIADKGGEVGPELKTIGGQRTKEQLLESILFPNKEISPGYEQVIVALKNDETEVGRVELESDAELTLILSSGERRRIPKADIRARKRGLSAMPEDAAKVLSKRDLRDLVAFLAGLR